MITTARRASEDPDLYEQINDAFKSHQSLTSIDGFLFRRIGSFGEIYTTVSGRDDSNLKATFKFSRDAFNDTLIVHVSFYVNPTTILKAVNLPRANATVVNQVFELARKLDNLLKTSNSARESAAASVVRGMLKSGIYKENNLMPVQHVIDALSNNGIEACSKIATAHGLVVARLFTEEKQIDLGRLLRRKRPFKVGPHLFNELGSIPTDGRYGINIDGWGERDRPCLVIYDKKLYDSTPHWLDKYSIEYDAVAPLAKVINDVDAMIKRVNNLNNRAKLRD